VVRRESSKDVEYRLDVVAHLVVPVVWAPIDDAEKCLHQPFKW
jgi:hypothetical protein